MADVRLLGDRAAERSGFPATDRFGMKLGGRGEALIAVPGLPRGRSDRSRKSSGLGEDLIDNVWERRADLHDNRR